MVDRVTEVTPFLEWIAEWTRIATYTGTHVDDVESRTRSLLALWDQPIPGDWQRHEIDARLRDPDRRYVRGNSAPDDKRRGEHRVEYEMLADLETAPVSCLGYRIVDGINAVPLSRDERGGRAGNIEADLVLLGEQNGRSRVFIAEVKVSSNNAWYAVVELLRQIRLYQDAAASRRLFHTRLDQVGHLVEDLPITGLVLAPGEFYAAAGQRAAAVRPAAALLRAICEHAGVDARLATWSAVDRVIQTLET